MLDVDEALRNTKTKPKPKLNLSGEHHESHTHQAVPTTLPVIEITTTQASAHAQRLLTPGRVAANSDQEMSSQGSVCHLIHVAGSGEQ